MEKDLENTSSDRSQIALIRHELAQSLLIIHAYAKGASERIKENRFEIGEIKSILDKINDQVEVMGKLIHSLP